MTDEDRPPATYEEARQRLEAGLAEMQRASAELDAHPFDVEKARRTAATIEDPAERQRWEASIADAQASRRQTELTNMIGQHVLLLQHTMLTVLERLDALEADD